MAIKNRQTEKQKPLGRRLIPWLILVVILFVVGLVVGTLQIGKAPEKVAPVADVSSQSAREVVLYFASADGQTLVAESRQITGCELDEDCLRETVQALISGPSGDMVPILPSRTTLQNLTVVDSLVQVDFSRELIDAHPGGAQSELLTVYGLTDTLAVNFPHLRQVQILVEGTPVATLKGHIDLRQPVYPDFSLVEEGAAPIGRMNSLPAGGEE
jgi:spore germination protein GerM